METYALDVTVADGKYTVRQNVTGKLYVLRYNEPWRDLCGDGLVYSLAAEVEILREEIKSLKDNNGS